MPDDDNYNPLQEATFGIMAYNAIGRASEIGTFPRYSLQHSTGNSGWSVGMIQTDFSSNAGHAATVSTMLGNYQAWTPQNKQFTVQELTSLSHRLQVGGQVGNALSQDEQSRINDYLRSDSGRAFVGELDKKQIDREWQSVGQPLSQIPWLQKLVKNDPAEAAEIVTMASKLYNQNEVRGGRLLTELQHNELTSTQVNTWIGHEGIHGLTPSAQNAIVSGRDNALGGVRLLNKLELGSGTLSRAWHQEAHVLLDADLSRDFSNNPDAQLFDAMMRDPDHGARIFEHVDQGLPAQATTIQGATASARREMSQITLERAGELLVVNPSGDRFERTDPGWKKNGVLMQDPHPKDGQNQIHPAAVEPTVLPISLDQPAHPDHALFRQALTGVHQIDANLGRTPDQHSDNLAGALTVAAKAKGMSRIDEVAIQQDGTRAFAAQNHLGFSDYAEVNTLAAINTPLEKSSAAALATPASETGRNPYAEPQEQALQPTLSAAPGLH